MKDFCCYLKQSEEMDLNQEDNTTIQRRIERKKIEIS